MLGLEVASPPVTGWAGAHACSAHSRTGGFGPYVSAACGTSTASIAAITMPAAAANCGVTTSMRI